MITTRAFLFTAFALLYLLQVPARATTIIPLSDEDLAVSSRAIVEARCLSFEARWNEDHTAVYTYITLKVTRVIKGDVPVGRVVIRQIGGATGDAVTQVWGAPYWAPQWKFLLYLNSSDDGSLHVAHLSQGYFRIIAGTASGKAHVSRPNTGVSLIQRADDATVTDSAPYDAYVARLTRVLALHASESEAYESRWASPIRLEPAEYTGLEKRQAKFTFLRPESRWFEPDSTQEVRFAVNSSGAPSSSGGLDEARAAAEAWSTVQGSSLRVSVRAGGSACGLKADSASAISFGDCAGQIDDPVNCSGIVALGGVLQAVTSQTTTIGGRTFAKILDADVVFNNGFDCLLSDPERIGEVMTHEIGHALGFGHSSDTRGEANPLLADATMFFSVHRDGRGASIRPDDADAARFVYRATGNGAGLAILTEALPDASPGVPYTFDLKASGSGPFTWSLVDGGLPNGMFLDTNGRFTGAPVATGASSVAVRVRDGANFEQVRSLSLTVTATPSPFLESATFAGTKLTIKGSGFDGSSSVSVNGIAIAPPRPVKFKATKGSLLLKGAAADLNVRSGATNTVVVVVGGRTSNTLRF